VRVVPHWDRKGKGGLLTAHKGMNSEQVEQKIRQILFGKAITDISDQSGYEQIFIIRSLTGKEDALVLYAHQKALQEGRKNGLITQAELKREFKQRGLWTDREEAELESYKQEISRLKNALPDFKFQKAKWHQINNRLKRVQEDLANLEKIRRELFMPALEYRAQEIKFRKIAFFCLETIDENSFWTSQSFDDWEDFIFVNNVVDAYARVFMVNEPTIREIVRSGQWRFRWLGTKNGADLFGKPACEWSDAQNALIYWSLYYDMVFDDPDCPHELINDDDHLDRWMRRQRKERELRKDVYKGRKSKAKDRNKFAHGTEEIFVFTDRGDKEAIAEIQGMNDPATRARLRTERKVLEEKGKVREWDLRKSLYLGAKD